MRWLMLRGLVREQRHWLDFPTTFARQMGQDGVPAHVVTIDLPGFGTQSNATVPPGIEGFVDDVRARFAAQRAAAPGNEPWGILAISLGGMVALRWLAQHPEDFGAGVVINTSAGDLSSLTERFALRHWPRVFIAPWLSHRSREHMLLKMTRNVDEATVLQVLDAYDRIAQSLPPKPKQAFAQIRAAAKSTTPASIQAPLLVMTAKTDRLVSYRCSEKIAARLQADIVTHPWAGHDLPLDDPMWTITELRQWLARRGLAPRVDPA
jgi:pimeloyl-ACP methyl ester carboxylesterase